MEKKPLPIEDHYNKPVAYIGKYTIRAGMENDSKVWIETEDGEGGDFPVELLEPLIDKFYKKHF